MTMSGVETVDGAAFIAEAQTEQEFMRHVIAYAKARSWMVYHTHISKRSTEGWPDLAIVRDGRMVFAELKREKGGRVSPAQRQWLDELGKVALVANAGLAAWATPTLTVACWKPGSWPAIEQVLR
jgi:hypothetical protein